MYICIYVYMYTCIYVYICISLSPYIYTYIYIYIHTRSPKDGLMQRLREPATRERVLSETAESWDLPELKEFRNIMQPWKSIYRWTDHYEPDHALSVEATAAERGLPPLRVAYDLLTSEGVLWKPYSMYGTEDHSKLLELLQSDMIIPGAADAGAHATLFQDASAPSHMVTHWARDRTRGPKLSLERVVKKNTADVAEFWGLRDRGVLAAGKKADLNVFDLGRLRIRKPHYEKDLPMGAGRWLQEVDGYRLTLVAGRETFRDGVPTGELPGRLVRNPRRDAGAWRHILLLLLLLIIIIIVIVVLIMIITVTITNTMITTRLLRRGVAASVAGPFEAGGAPADDVDARRRALEGAVIMITIIILMIIMISNNANTNTNNDNDNSDNDNNTNNANTNNC